MQKCFFFNNFEVFLEQVFKWNDKSFFILNVKVKYIKIYCHDKLKTNSKVDKYLVEFKCLEYRNGCDDGKAMIRQMMNGVSEEESRLQGLTSL